ncbi:MAG TPA: hypothetical protein PKJ16_02610 [Spirochaetota bacterium]|nr:hypothetical protein [Spirochaetota bacterium]HOS40157.1 hypothetical protein [Spirochaetota bacterium]HPU90292.1 hypothetical protein [Spirochaetota bacterium]
MKSPDFHQDFLDMICALESAGCRYIIVGGYAMAFNGYVRATGDIDILVEPEKDNALKVMHALSEFGAPLHGVTAEDFGKEGTIFQIGLPPVRIDIITKIDGLTFDEAYADRNYHMTDDAKIPFLSLDSIVKNKNASGREKDILDIKELLKRKEKRT